MTLIGDELRPVAAALIFAFTYFVVAIGRLPGFRVDRAGGAFLGGALMVASGVLTLDEATKAIDLDTIALLLGMMIVVANLRLAGMFDVITAWAVRRAHGPVQLLLVVVLVSGVLSAFLVNDAVCLVLAPLVLEIVLRLRRNAVPYMLALAMASNAGSVATITGNPQNMIIGGLSRIPYIRFAGALWPVAAVGLALTFGLIWIVWRSEFAAAPFTDAEQGARKRPPHRPMLLKTLGIALLMVAAFFAGVAPAAAAVVAGGILLLTRRVRVEKIYAEIDWTLLLMFAGLFVVVAGMEKAVLTPDVAAAVGRLHLSNVAVLSVVTAVLSNIVSNVPAVLVLRPFVATAADPTHAWLTIAMASTLAGNFTLLGSVANLIVAERARRRGVTIGFVPYFAVGAPLTVLTIAAGVLILR